MMKGQTMQQPKHAVAMPVPLWTQLMDYMGGQPHREVGHLIDALRGCPMVDMSAMEPGAQGRTPNGGTPSTEDAETKAARHRAEAEAQRQEEAK
jgi:hypothetical protein